MSNQNKSAFTLVELAIVIAVIAALSVALVSSKELIEAARISSMQKKLIKLEQNIGEYTVSNGKPGIFSSHNECTRRTGNPMNFCATLSDSQGGTSGGQYSSVEPAPYQMNVELSLAGYIDEMPMLKTTTGDLVNPSVNTSVSMAIAGFTTRGATLGLSLGTLPHWRAFIGTNYRHWGDLLPSFDSKSVYNITFSLTAPTTGVVFNAPYSSFQTSSLLAGDTIGGKYVIHIFGKSPETSAAMTSRMAWKLDQKISTGNPSTGKFLTGRMFTTYGGTTGTCFDGADLAATGCTTSVWTSEISPSGGQVNTTSFACFNSQAVSAGGESGSGFFTHDSANANANAKYTAAATQNSHLISSHTGTEATGMTDSRRKAIVRQAESDLSMGCNIAYFTNIKWNG